jgi:hypothetical protein
MTAPIFPEIPLCPSPQRMMKPKLICFELEYLYLTGANLKSLMTLVLEKQGKSHHSSSIACHLIPQGLEHFKTSALFAIR